jgi:D-alanine-D-alanine ligase
MVQNLLGLDKGAAVVDLCGGEGRHACALYRRGFRHVTVVDYSEFLVQTGAQMAASEGLGITFVRADARNTGLRDGSFDTALVMANSFGYFHDAADDRRFLEEAYRVLACKGKLLLDVVDAEFAKGNFQPRSWHEIGQDILVCRGRKLDNDVVLSREIVISKKEGLIRDQAYSVRLYTAEKITHILEDVGFTPVTVHRGFCPHDQSVETPHRDEITSRNHTGGSLNGEIASPSTSSGRKAASSPVERLQSADYGFLTNRLIAIAQKP